MPQYEDASRRTARERSQTRGSRSGDSRTRSRSRVSTDSYGRARQEVDDRSQSRYDRQRQSTSPRPSRESRAGESSRTARSSRSSSSSRAPHSGSSSRSARPSSQRTSRTSRSAQTQTSRRSQQTTRSRQTRQQPGVIIDIPALLAKLPKGAGGIAIIAVAVIVVLFLIFGVLVPSCTRTPEPTQTQSASSAASSTQASDESQSSQSLVSQIAQAKVEAQAEVESASQVGSLETSNSKIEALVSLLGEEETAKLVAQAKTNTQALWIAAHPDAYAFDGIEIQYKILKLAADEPAAISYVREFPAKYPMADAVTDKDLAMDVASPSSAVETTPIPHLYQWDRRWAYTVYSSATFGLTGCGPTSLAMVYQGLNRTVDKTPHDMAVLAEERGYMSEYNGTDSSFFLDVAGELGLNCWESYPDATNIRDELSQGHVIIANLGPGYFTTNGHFFVLTGIAENGQIIINDPYSVVRSSQTWDADFLASETIAMFVYSKA